MPALAKNNQILSKTKKVNILICFGTVESSLAMAAELSPVTLALTLTKRH